MAAYPTSPSFRTTVEPINQTNFTLTESGVPRGTNITADTAYRITVTHPAITSSQVATLRSFFSTNQSADNTITANDGVTYDVNFRSNYRVTLFENSPTLFNAEVQLIGNAQ